jgi:Baseplate J-like protein
MATLEELKTPATAEQVEATIVSVAEAVELPVSSWNPFGISRSMIKVMARSISVYSTLLSDLACAPFLGYARGSWLTLLAKYNYGTTRYAATYASGVITVTNSRPVAQSFPSGTLVVANAVTGKTYRNSAPYVSAGSDTVSVPFLAEEAGTASTSQTGQITQLVTSVVGLSVTNALAFIGVDEETDSSLTDRARLSRSALSPNGAKDAYRYVLTSPDLNPTLVPITRVIAYPSYGDAHVVIFIANAAGTPDAGDLAISYNSVVSQVEPQGIISYVYGATPITVDVTATITVENESLNDAAIAAACTTAAGNYINSLPIGGKVIPPSLGGRVDASMLAARIAVALPSIVDVSIVTPAADIAVIFNEVASLGTVAFTVVRV